jgi:trimeric autotransporter adhesin
MKNIYCKIATVAFACLSSISGNAQNIFTVAGTGTRATSVMGEGGAATSAAIGAPTYVTVDGSGNYYFSDSTNSVVRKITTAGVITTIAGTGTAGYGGDGGPATAAQLNVPCGLAVDATGNVFIADGNNYCIRKVDATTGNISTYAGTPTFSLSPTSRGVDGRPATADSLKHPWGIALDASGNLYIADFDCDKIRKVTASSGIMTTAAGNGPGSYYAGDGYPATDSRVRLWNPSDVAVDAVGNVFFADSHNNCIREIVASTGIILTAAGAPPAGGYIAASGPATTAFLEFNRGVTVDAAGNFFIAETQNNVVFEVTSGYYNTVAGTTFSNYNGDGIPAVTANIGSPRSVKVDIYGNVLIADMTNYRIRRVGNHGLDVKQNEASSISMTLYPNPNKGRFTVNGSFSSKDDQQASIEVTDMLGHVVYKNNIDAPLGRINVPVNIEGNLPDGFYLLLVRSQTESSVTRFVVRR